MRRCVTSCSSLSATYLILIEYCADQPQGLQQRVSFPVIVAALCYHGNHGSASVVTMVTMVTMVTYLDLLLLLAPAGVAAEGVIVAALCYHGNTTVLPW